MMMVFLMMIDQYKSTCDGHFGNVSMAKHLVNMDSLQASPIHAALYIAGPANASS